jgi:K+-transporting ATPase KdpF subunit
MKLSQVRLPVLTTQISTQVSTQIIENMTEIWSEWRRQKLPLYLFLGLCFNLVLAPAVFAATGGEMSRSQSYWLATLGLVTIALAVYLFFVMFVPEKF